MCGPISKSPLIYQDNTKIMQMFFCCCCFFVAQNDMILITTILSNIKQTFLLHQELLGKIQTHDRNLDPAQLISIVMKSIVLFGFKFLDAC